MMAKGDQVPDDPHQRVLGGRHQLVVGAQRLEGVQLGVGHRDWAVGRVGPAVGQVAGDDAGGLVDRGRRDLLVRDLGEERVVGEGVAVAFWTRLGTIRTARTTTMTTTERMPSGSCSGPASPGRVRRVGRAAGSVGVGRGHPIMLCATRTHLTHRPRLWCRGAAAGRTGRYRGGVSDRPEQGGPQRGRRQRVAGVPAGPPGGCRGTPGRAATGPRRRRGPHRWPGRRRRSTRRRTSDRSGADMSLGQQLAAGGAPVAGRRLDVAAVRRPRIPRRAGAGRGLRRHRRRARGVSPTS